MKPFYLRSKVGGLVFTDPACVPKGYTGFFSIEEWVDAKAPSNSLVYDDPTSLITVGLPILDGFLVEGVWHRHRTGRLVVPDESTVTFKRFTYYKVLRTSDMAKSTVKPPKRYPGLVAFMETTSSLKPKNQTGTLVRSW